MQTATAYLRKNKVFVHPDARTTDGVWIFWPPVLMQDAADGVELDAKILEALANSRQGVPHPADWTGLADPLLQAAGVKSWNTFAQSAKCVEIETAGNRIAFLPTRNGGVRDGFEPLSDKTVSSASEPGELGRSLLAAFAACE